MIELARRKLPFSYSMKYYSPISTSQSGENISNLYSMMILPQIILQHQNIQDSTNISRFSPQNNPLFFSVTKSQNERDFSSCVNDGIQRYKLVNNTDGYDITPAELFLSTLESLSCITIPRITFYTDAVKARITYHYTEFIIDYDYEEPESVFISTFEGDKLLVKDGPLRSMLNILESF